VTLILNIIKFQSFITIIIIKLSVLMNTGLCIMQGFSSCGSWLFSICTVIVVSSFVDNAFLS